MVTRRHRNRHHPQQHTQPRDRRRPLAPLCRVISVDKPVKPEPCESAIELELCQPRAADISAGQLQGNRSDSGEKRVRAALGS